MAVRSFLICRYTYHKLINISANGPCVCTAPDVSVCVWICFQKLILLDPKNSLSYVTTFKTISIRPDRDRTVLDQVPFKQSLDVPFAPWLKHDFCLLLQGVHSGWKSWKMSLFQNLGEKLESHRFFSCFGWKRWNFILGLIIVNGIIR